MTIETSKIVNRLELIKNLIILEEVTEINIHVAKLKESPPNDDLKYITHLLEQKAYSQVIPAIDKFLQTHNAVALYLDPELEALKLEAKVLEKEINDLSSEKADIERLIHEFGVRHSNELGELILKILSHRKKKAEGTPQQAETEKDYNDFSQKYQIAKDEKINELTNDELRQLKLKYRKASKLCHPDVVNADQKELAENLFAELNSAYEKNDLKKVTEILANLERGDYFVSKSDAIHEKQLLKTEIEKLRLRIEQLRNQLQIIRNSEAYITIVSIDDWGAYFKSTRQKLNNQLRELENGRE